MEAGVEESFDEIRPVGYRQFHVGSYGSNISTEDISDLMPYLTASREFSEL